MMGLSFVTSTGAVVAVAAVLGLYGWIFSLSSIPTWVLAWALAFAWTAFWNWVVDDWFKHKSEEKTEEAEEARKGRDRVKAEMEELRKGTEDRNHSLLNRENAVALREAEVQTINTSREAAEAAAYSANQQMYVEKNRADKAEGLLNAYKEAAEARNYTFKPDVIGRITMDKKE